MDSRHSRRNKAAFSDAPAECERAALNEGVVQLATGATNNSYFMYVIRKSDTYYIFTYFASLFNSFILVSSRVTNSTALFCYSCAHSTLAGNCSLLLYC